MMILEELIVLRWVSTNNAEAEGSDDSNSALPHVPCVVWFLREKGFTFFFRVANPKLPSTSRSFHSPPRNHLSLLLYTFILLGS